jgi:flagellar basal-body rod protein FlgF
MDSSVYVLGNRMDGLADNLQLIAGNLANANTPGFKRSVGRFTAALQQARSSPSGATWAVLDGDRIDFSAGPTRRTGRSLDLAIRGDAFFVLDTPAGRCYSRKGRLYVNTDGELTDGAGNRFAGRGGSISIPPGAADVQVAPDGQVSAGGSAVGRLMLVDIRDRTGLVPQGAGLYRDTSGSEARAVGSEVIQGAIEESNVNPMLELVGLLEVMRAYEASARLVRKMDTLSSQLIKSAA